MQYPIATITVIKQFVLLTDKCYGANTFCIPKHCCILLLTALPVSKCFKPAITLNNLTHFSNPCVCNIILIKHWSVSHNCKYWLKGCHSWPCLRAISGIALIQRQSCHCCKWGWQRTLAHWATFSTHTSRLMTLSATSLAACIWPHNSPKGLIWLSKDIHLQMHFSWGKGNLANKRELTGVLE